MSPDNRRTDNDSTRDARFGTRTPGNTRNRQLFATRCKRRNCASRAQPIHLSRTVTLNAPAHQPSNATQTPSGVSATCRSPPPTMPRNPR